MEIIITFLTNTALPVLWNWVKIGLSYFFFETVQWLYLISIMGIGFYIMNKSPWSESEIIAPKNPKKRRLRKRLVIFLIATIGAGVADIFYLVSKGFQIEFFNYNLNLLITFIFSNILYLGLVKKILLKYNVLKPKAKND